MKPSAFLAILACIAATGLATLGLSLLLASLLRDLLPIMLFILVLAS